jgi:hypothetical protein
MDRASTRLIRAPRGSVPPCAQCGLIPAPTTELRVARVPVIESRATSRPRAFKIELGHFTK